MAKYLATAVLLLLALGSRAADREVIVYTSANYAPLVVDARRGIYHDLVDYLNRQHLGYQFSLSYLPRKRLQVKVEEGSIDGIVIGMMPQWFDDAEQKKYLWTVPFAMDRFVLVAQANSNISTETPKSLQGASVGLVNGYSYPGIDPWLEQNRMVRNMAPSEETNLEKLTLGRIDSTITPNSIVNYYIRKNRLFGKLRISPVPGVGTERRFLVPFAQRAVYDKIAPVVRKLADDPEWRKLMLNYE